MTDRQKIPPSAQAEILINSGRRCCLCFGLHRDTGVKKGQIAHLNQDRRNNNASNLVYLCFDHHDEFDSTTRQSKGLTQTEIAVYRERLYDYVRTTFSAEATSKDFVVSSIEEQASVLDVIDRYWNVGHSSPATLSAEITLRMQKVRDYQRLEKAELREIESSDNGEEEKERRWLSATRRLREAIGLPEGIWGLHGDGAIPEIWFRNFRRLTKRWSQGKLSHSECGQLYWLLDEDLDFDQYYILFGLPQGTIGALGIAAFDSFLYHFGLRNQPNQPIGPTPTASPRRQARRP